MDNLINKLNKADQRHVKLAIIHANNGNMNKIKFSEQITQSGYDKNSYVYGVLRSLRDKINAPTRQKK